MNLRITETISFQRLRTRAVNAMVLKQVLTRYPSAWRQVSTRRYLCRKERCSCHFHTSVRTRVDDQGSRKNNDAELTHNVPDTGRSRKQQEAAVSEEVKIIQRDHPSSSFAEPDPNKLRPPGAGSAVDPESIGQDESPGRMGENVRVSQTSSITSQDTPLSSNERAKDPAEYGIGVTDPTDESAVLKESKSFIGSQSEGTTIPEPESVTSPGTRSGANLGTAQRSSTDKMLERADAEHIPQASTPPTSQSVGNTDSGYQGLLAHGTGTATIAGSNFQSVIINRISEVAESGYRKHQRDSYTLAAKMQQGQLMHFQSKKEKADVERLARRKFQPLPENARQSLVDRMVKGIYDESKAIGGGNPSQPVLAHIAKATLLNSTYNSNDAKRFARKVSSLLPAASNQNTRKKAREST